MIDSLKFDSKSPFTPSFNIPIYRQFLDADVTSKLADLVIQEERGILDSTKPSSKPGMENPLYHDDWLTNRNWDYNLLDFSDKHPVLDDLRKWIKEQYHSYVDSLGLPRETVYIQCWANIIRNDGRQIIKHHHADAHAWAPQDHAYCSGNICIQAKNTHTHYQNPVLPKLWISIKNEPSELVLFPSWMVHWTDKNESFKPRISIAFDLITEEVYNMIKGENKTYRLL